MATTEPLTGVTVQDQSDAATGGTQIGNLAKTLARFTVPRFTSTSQRDTQYAAMVSGGGVMADGMVCSAAGVPYRRINGTWRIDRNRNIPRTASITGGGSIAAGGAAETGVTAGFTGMSNFTLYEACTVAVQGSFRANPASTAGAALCEVKIDGVSVGNVGVSRSDETVTVVGVVALAAGAHGVAMRVTTNGGVAVTWQAGNLVIAEGTAE